LGAFGVLARIIALDVSASVYLLVNDLLQYHVLTLDLVQLCEKEEKKKRKVTARTVTKDAK
jgi:hypothetical protein